MFQVHDLQFLTHGMFVDLTYIPGLRFITSRCLPLVIAHMFEDRTCLRGRGNYSIPVSVAQPMTVWPIKLARVVDIFGTYPKIRVVH